MIPNHSPIFTFTFTPDCSTKSVGLLLLDHPATLHQPLLHQVHPCHVERNTRSHVQHVSPWLTAAVLLAMAFLRLVLWPSPRVFLLSGTGVFSSDQCFSIPSFFIPSSYSGPMFTAASSVVFVVFVVILPDCIFTSAKCFITFYR